jgi:DNA modification methylase
MGSGSTIIACQNTLRNYIGIEMDGEIFKVAEKRINENALAEKEK